MIGILILWKKILKPSLILFLVPFLPIRFVPLLRAKSNGRGKWKFRELITDEAADMERELSPPIVVVEIPRQGMEKKWKFATAKVLAFSQF